MKAVILAAGLGTRLRPLTLKTPKPMLHLNGKPILEYTIRSLPKEVTEVIVVVHYLSEKIKKYFGREFQGRRMRYIYQPRLIGTWDALIRCKKLLAKEDKFFVCYADDLYNPRDLKRMMKYPRAILVMRHKNPERYGVAKLDKQGRVTAIIEKPKKYVGNLISIGVYTLGKDFFKLRPYKLKDHKEFYLSYAVGEIAKRYPIHAVRTSFWVPIGYPEDLKRAAHIVKKRRF